MKHLVAWLGIVVSIGGCGARSSLDVTLPEGTSDAAAPIPDAATHSRHVVSLAAGWNHACAVLSDGTARCWGDNTSAQLGAASPSQSDQAIPLAAPTRIVAMAGGYDQTVALVEGGGLWCWGGNDVAECGVDASASNLPPTLVQQGYSQASAAFDYGCGVRLDGTVACWGSGDDGQLGNMASSSFFESTPTSVSGVQGAVYVSTSEYVTCAMLTVGDVLCWGLGPLGNAGGADSVIPVHVAGLAHPATELAVGSNSACALLSDESVVCWGYGGYGELGLGAGTSLSNEPGTVTLSGPAKAISSGEYHACALLADGTAECWGMGSAEQAESFSPVPVPGLASATAIASGEGFDCALLASGAVVCWGDNAAGQLGNGTTVASATPVTVMGLP